MASTPTAPASAPDSPQSAPPKGKRGFVGFLFGTWLGRGLVLILLLLAVVALAPSFLGGFVKNTAQEAFKNRFEGSLALDDVSLAWFGEQRVTNALVRDPSGAEVARASVTLPGLFALLGASSGKIGRVVVDVDATLVQDDAGITNLQRALAPRTTTPESKSTPAEEGGDDPLEMLAQLDLDLEIRAKRLSWSDADTRRLAIPFEVRDMTAKVVAQPNRPTHVTLDGRLVSEQPGALHVDARVNGPIAPKAAWPFGKVDADVRVEGFSTAMIDGLANLQGNLKEVLGARFTLKSTIQGATLDSGDVSVTLDGERASVALACRMEGGVLRSAGEPGLLATFPAPRGFLKAYVDPNLPPGTELLLEAAAGDGSGSSGAAGAPWVLRAVRFAVPLPPSGARDLATLKPTLEKAEIDLSLSVPSRFGVRNEATRAANVDLAVSDLRAEAHVTPGQPVTAQLEARLDSGTTGAVRVNVSARDAWARLATNQLPNVDAQASITGLSTAALGALAGQVERARGALGQTLDVELDARDVSLSAGVVKLVAVGREPAAGDTPAVERFGASAQLVVEGGLVHVRGDERVTLRWRAAPEWLARELATFLPEGTTLALDPEGDTLSFELRDVVVPLPATLGTSSGGAKGATGDYMADVRARTGATARLALTGATYADATLRAAGTAASVRGLVVDATLAPGGAARVRANGRLERGADRGSIALDGTVANAFAFVDAKSASEYPPLDLDVKLDGVPTALVDAFVGPRGLVRRAAGDSIALALVARGASLQGGAVQLDVRTPKASLALTGRVDKGVFRATGEDRLVVNAQVPADLVEEFAGASMPAGTSLVWPQDGAALALSVRELTVPVPDLGGTQPFDLDATLRALAAQLDVRLNGIGVATNETRAAGLDVAMRDVAIEASVSPSKPLALRVGAAVATTNSGVGTAEPARLAVTAEVSDPFAVLRGAALAPIDATFELAGLETRVLDALAGPGDDLARLLGARLTAKVEARGASETNGAFTATLTSDTTNVSFRGRMQDRVVTCTGDEGLDASIRLAPEFVAAQVQPHVPPGTRLALAADAGPFVARVRDVSVALPAASTTTGSAGAKPSDGSSAAPAAGSGVAPSGAQNTAVAGADAGLDTQAVLELVSKLALRAEIDFPTITYSDAATDAAGRPVVLRDVKAVATLSSSALPTARVSAVLVDEPPGQLSFDVAALEPLAKLAEANGLDTWRVRVGAQAKSVPTAILDVLASQDGLLVESLGARVDVDVSAPDLSLARGEFTASMKSDLHGVTARGHLESRTIVVDQVDGVVAQIGLGPVTSKRFVGKLVPTLVNVSKPAGAEPARFSVDALRFPLDGDLRKLDGTVRVDLGDVTYSLFPKLDMFLGDGAGGPALQSLRVPALTVPISKGVAGYQRLPLRIGSREYVFSGTYDMVTDVAQLTANVPVKYLGKKVSAELEKVREYVDPELTLPLTIKGSLLNPSIGLDSGALSKLIEDAAGRALEKAGGSLLDDLLKKKKKKD